MCRFLHRWQLLSLLRRAQRRARERELQARNRGKRQEERDSFQRRFDHRWRPGLHRHGNEFRHLQLHEQEVQGPAIV